MTPRMTRRQDSGTLEEITWARWKASLARPERRMKPITAKLFFTSFHLQPIKLINKIMIELVPSNAATALTHCICR